MTKLSLAMLLLASIARPDQRADRDAFSEAIFVMDSDIADAKRNFSKILEPFQDGKPGDRAELHKAYDRFTSTVASALSRASALKAPSTPDCRDVLKAFLDFLAVEQDPVALELKTILSKVDEKDGQAGFAGQARDHRHPEEVWRGGEAAARPLGRGRAGVRPCR